MKFDKNYFIKQEFSSHDLNGYRSSAKRDLDIAGESKEAEVKFHFAYMALIKIGLYAIAKEGYRVKSLPGHHQKIIESLAEIRNNEEIIIIGDKIRKERNTDFYGPDSVICDEDADRYIAFVEQLFKNI